MAKELSELWNEYFPVVSTSYIGSISKDFSSNNIYSAIIKYVIHKNGLNLLDIKGMSTQIPFIGLFPSKVDPAFKHWDKLNEELKKDVPVNIIEFFLKEEEKTFKEYNGKNIPHSDGLSELFINEIVNNNNWIFYDHKENVFKCDFSDIIHGRYKPNNIYEAFRCFVPRYYAYKYIKTSSDIDNKYVKNVIEGIKGNYKYFIPSENKFIEMIKNRMNVNTNLMNEWAHYRNNIYDILLNANLNKEAEDFTLSAKDGVNFLVEYINNCLLCSEDIRELLKNKVGNYGILEAKIKEYYEDRFSINDYINNDGEDKKEFIDYIGNNDYNITSFLNDQEASDVFIDLTEKKYEEFRKGWLDPFKKAFKNNEYANHGSFNFSTIEIFRRFVKWLISEILGENLTIVGIVNSKLFKDYCRVHELNGCKECIVASNKDSKEYIIAQSINGNTYDINKCTSCLCFSNNIHLLFPHYEVFKRRTNRFFNQISGGK